MKNCQMLEVFTVDGFPLGPSLQEKRGGGVKIIVEKITKTL